MSSTNFNTIQFNPHGHGTHTECLGHITRDFYSINQALKQFFSWLNWFRLLWRNEERI
jgi:hypothetical protein